MGWKKNSKVPYSSRDFNNVITSSGSMIVVSNRLPFVLKRLENGKLIRKASAGGLVTAVAPVVINGNGLWVGWPGIHLENPEEPIPESEPGDVTPTAGLKSNKVFDMEEGNPVVLFLYLKNSTNSDLCDDMIGTVCESFGFFDWSSRNVERTDVVALLPSTELVNRNEKRRLVKRSRQELQDFYLSEVKKKPPHDVVAVHVDPAMFDSYYNGACNGTFWPLFHSMPDRATFKLEEWKNYVAVNKLFADCTIQALKSLKRGKNTPEHEIPLIWVHDYQLMLAASWIRQAAEEEGMPCKLGFFLHIPFPPWDIFRLLPWGDEILQGILNCDMVGFHITDYCLNFVDCCQRYLGCRVDRKNLLVEQGGRSVRVRPLPIGIPFERFVELAENAPKVFSGEQKIVLGVDRLDYTKGLVHRLLAFEMLLEKHPEHRGQVSMLQVAVPSRTDVKEYQELKETLEQLIGRINGKFTTPNWSPIRYIYGQVSQDDLAGYYRDAFVGLVTPLRDGMNLVAKEFVACQINSPPGVLIVSPFAGAGETMHEALVCNPYEIDGAAEVLHRALTMPEDERILRMNYLRRREQVNDVNFWTKSFLSAMGSLFTPEDRDDVGSTMMPAVTLDDFDEYLAKYIGETHKLALLLDYDGTLAPLAPHPDLAVMPTETRNVLIRLANIPDVYIAVVSGRNVNNVKEMVGIEGITYAGNHGLEILHSDGTKFVHPMPPECQEKVGSLLAKLQEQVCRDGAWVENKGALLTFHFREVPVHKRGDLEKQARKLIEEAGFKAGKAHCAIEAKPKVEWNKGRASIYILRTAFGVDWSERIRIIYVGDDVTDEDAMMALKGMAATFRVTNSTIIKTAAERRLPSTDSVLTLLKWIERHFSKRTPSPIDPTVYRRGSLAKAMTKNVQLECEISTLAQALSNKNAGENEQED